MSIILRLLPYLGPRRAGLALLLGLMCLSSGLELLKPWPMKIAVDNVISALPLEVVGLRPFEGLSVYAQTLLVIAFMVAVNGATSLVHLASNYISAKVGQDMVQDFRFDFFNHLQRQSMRFHQRHPIGDLTYRIMGDTYCVQSIFLNMVITIIWNVLFLAGIVYVLVRMDPGLTLAGLAVAPLLLLSIVLFGKKLETMSVDLYSKETRVSAILEQIFYSLPLVQAFAREEYEHSRFSSVCRSSFDRRLALNCLQTGYNGMNGLLTTLGMGAVLYVGISHVAEGVISTGDLFVFISYMVSLFQPLNALAYTATNYRSSLVQAKRVVELLDVDEAVHDKPGAPPLVVQQGEVRFEGVSFSYTGSAATLQSVDLVCPPGATVALVGRTGSGKTTLTSLLLRFYDPNQGRILIDGQDIREVSLKSLRNNISVVLQDTFLFPASVRENILYGRREASLEEVVEAARTAGAHEFIEKLPEGYETVLGERGMNLSGGQRQRLSIARALLKNAPILVLDEPTSSLDAATEEAILESLDNLMHGRTTLVVAHRQSMIRRADLIVVVREGSIAETGTYRDLMAHDGEFRSILHSLTTACGQAA